MSTRYSRSKWTKYNVMRKFADLRRHLPETRRISQIDFEAMIAEYGDIVFKPSGGSRGSGVVRVSAVGQDAYMMHTENIKRIVNGKAQAYNYVRTITGAGSYIVQRRIPLATVDDRPFDVRVIVQRGRLSDSWKVTGKVAKVAGKDYIVTNITRSKGTVLPVATALKRSSLTHYSGRTLLSGLDKVALLAAGRLCNSKLYSNQRIFGFDMGLDQNGHVWLIEANLKPMISHFRKLKDKTMYHRILKYKN